MRIFGLNFHTEYYHIDCFEDLVDLDSEEFIDKIEIETKFSIDPGYILGTKANRAVVEWFQAKVQRLAKERNVKKAGLTGTATTAVDKSIEVSGSVAPGSEAGFASKAPAEAEHIADTSNSDKPTVASETPQKSFALSLTDGKRTHECVDLNTPQPEDDAPKSKKARLGSAEEISTEDAPTTEEQAPVADGPYASRYSAAVCLA